MSSSSIYNQSDRQTERERERGEGDEGSVIVSLSLSLPRFNDDVEGESAEERKASEVERDDLHSRR